MTSFQMMRVIKRAEDKVTVLSRWTSENIEAYNQMRSQWNVFNDLLNAHKETIHRQVEIGCNSLNLFQLTHQISFRWTR